jgi:fibronectin type 3 domain-containing protein
MKLNLKTIAGLTLALFSVVAGRAAVIAYEPFDYPAGTLANNTPATGPGFTGNWTVSAFPQIVNTVLTYPSLTPVNRAYQHAAAGAQTTVGLASPLSSGTKYISYLFKGSGGSGADTVGVFFKGDNATSLFCGFRVPNTGTHTGFGLGSVNSTTLGAATLLGSAVNINHTDTHFIVIKIDFDTAGALDTVSLWIDPPANAATPGVAANVVNSTFDVGSIGAFGINITGGYNPILDEIRMGDTYGDVTAYVPPPDAPMGLVATPGNNTVSLSWDVTSGATGYKVMRGTSTGVYTVTNSVASNTNFDATVVGGTTYFYAVQATNASGGGALSAEVSVTPTIALPSTPVGFSATGTNSAVLLSWNIAAGATGYNVKRATTSGAEVAIASTGATSYTDSAVVNGTTYFYTVSSTNSAGESADSLEASAVPNVPPATPTALIATAGSNQVSLSWTGAAGAVSYNVKRSTTSGSGYSTIGTTVDPTVAYVDATAVKFTQYYYVVSAVNAYGESADSSPEATATPTGAYGPTAYEPFNYTAGAFANNTPSTAAGFTGNWTIPTGATIAAGRTYPDLPTTSNAYQHNASGSQNTVNFASPMSSGTKYISFLIKNSGNSGGDAVGVFLKGNNASSLFAGFRGGFTGSETLFGLGTVNSTSLGGASALGSGTVPLSNTATNFIVLKIDFNTSGGNETVSLWTNPPVAVETPGVAASITANTFDVGTISAFGVNILGGYAAVIDEIRVGDVYGDVVGYSAVSVPTIPTTVSISTAQGEQVSWTASSANTYQPQKSADNSTWSNVGSLLIGDAVTSVYETTSAAYYRVLEFVAGGPGADEMVNGSFEIPAGNNVGAANWNGPASNGTVNQYVTNQFDVLLPTAGTNLLFIEGQGGSGSVVQSDFVPVSGGLTYKVVFDAANPLKSGGGNPQFRVEFFDAGNAVVGSSGFVSFASAGSSWVTFSNNYAAPANATKMIIGFLEAVGAGPTDHWITLVDNVTVSALATISSTNVLAPARQLGAVFTGTVQTNGVTAAVATGTITFQTNSVLLSANSVAAGSATSATVIVTPPYTVTAIYSGDNTYIGSTNTLTVNNATATVTLGNLNQAYDGTAKSATAITTPAGLTVAFTYDGSPNAPTNAGTYVVIGSVVDALYVGSATNNLVITNSVSNIPTNITSSVTGDQLTISWPESHLGWILQGQTNALSTGIGGTWYDVPGSEAGTQAVITIDPVNPTVFFRLRSP